LFGRTVHGGHLPGRRTDQRGLRDPLNNTFSGTGPPPHTASKSAINMADLSRSGARRHPLSDIG
jgi:hypothetical protein